MVDILLELSVCRCIVFYDVERVKTTFRPIFALYFMTLAFQSDRWLFCYCMAIEGECIALFFIKINTLH